MTPAVQEPPVRHPRTSPAVDVQFKQESGMGARCTRCFLDGKLMHEHSTGQPIDYETDRCPGCQEPICDRHGDRARWSSRIHSASDHPPAHEPAQGSAAS